MREKTVTVREGEYLGPVDDGYDFESHDWDHGGSTNPECIQRGREFLRRLQGPGEPRRTAVCRVADGAGCFGSACTTAGRSGARCRAC
jgi:hypothetical protein